MQRADTGESLATLWRLATAAAAARRLQENGPACGPTGLSFQQGLFAPSPPADAAADEWEAAAQHFGLEHEDWAELRTDRAAAADLPAGLCKLKGDLLLLELALPDEAVVDEYERPAWLASVRDAATAAELQRAVRGLADSVRTAWLQPWYAGLARLAQSRGPGGPQEPHDDGAGAAPPRRAAAAARRGRGEC
jgi:hypothetical protein